MVQSQTTCTIAINRVKDQLNPTQQPTADYGGNVLEKSKIGIKHGIKQFAYLLNSK